MDVIRRFMASGRPGIYFKVLTEGEIQRDDKIKIIRRDKNNVTVKDIVSLYIARNDIDNIETIKRATKIRDLPEGWRHEFQQKIEQLKHKWKTDIITYYLWICDYFLLFWLTIEHRRITKISLQKFPNLKFQPIDFVTKDKVVILE